MIYSYIIFDIIMVILPQFISFFTCPKKGQFFEGCTNAILHKPLFRILFCLLMCAFFYTVVFFIYPIQFETNDDPGQMYIYAGYLTGRPSVYIPHSACSIFLGYIVSGLYGLFPAFPCYSIFFITVMLISSVIVSYCIIETAGKCGTSLLITALFCVLFLCVFTLRPFVLIQFTTVAAFPAAASIALAITFEPLSRGKTTIRCALIAILILLSYVIRRDVFTPAAVILCGVLFYKSLNAKRMIILFLAITAFVLVGIIADKNITAHVQKSPEWAAYNNFKKRFMPNGEVLSVRDLEEMGLEPIEQFLISDWCFLLECLNDGSLLNAANVPEIKSSHKSVAVRVKTATKALMPLLQDRHSRFLYFVLFAMFVFAFILLPTVPSTQETHDILGLFCISKLFLILAFIVFHCFIAYLCLFGRQFFPTRVQYTLMMLIAPYIIIASCALCGKLVKKDFYEKARFFIVFALIACIVSGIQLLLSSNELQARKDALEGGNSVMERIALHYPDCFFIYDSSLLAASSSPFKVFGKRKPVNLMFWGGWSYLSPIWYRQLQLNGIDELNYRSFLNDNVFLLSRFDINTIYNYNMLFPYMENKFSEINGFFNVVAEYPFIAGAIYIYKFFTASEDL